MTYSEAIEFLFNQLPMFQRTGPSAYKDNLDNTLRLDEWFGHPHRRFKTIHVAGTNGKGSVSHMLASVLQEAGYKTGLYTSPHLKDFRERIRINGKMISEGAVTDFVKNHRAIIEKISPSFFEMTVAMAFDYFASQKVEVAVIEVGLGGRLDSTNIINPEVSVITNIGMDHMALLGNTLPLIAREKAGIIKEKTPLVIGQTQAEVLPVFHEVAAARNAPLVLADKYYKTVFKQRTTAHQEVDVYRQGLLFLAGVQLPLLGQYQLFNVAAVCTVVDQLSQIGYRLSAEHLKQGLQKVVVNTGLAGRWQILDVRPTVVCDTGHNEDGLREVVAQIKVTPNERLHMVIGMVNDKDLEPVLKLLPTEATYYFTRARIPRSLDANVLKQAAEPFGLIGEAYQTVEAAYAEAKKNAGVNDLIFIGGSTFVVAEVF